MKMMWKHAKKVVEWMGLTLQASQTLLEKEAAIVAAGFWQPLPRSAKIDEILDERAAQGNGHCKLVSYGAYSLRKPGALGIKYALIIYGFLNQC